MEELLTIQETAKLLDKTDDSIIKAIRRGALPAEKLGRQWVIRRADFEHFRDNPPRAGRPRKPKPKTQDREGGRSQ